MPTRRPDVWATGSDAAYVAERAAVRTVQHYLLWRVSWGRMPFNTRRRPDGAFFADEWSSSDLWRLIEEGGVLFDGARLTPRAPVPPDLRVVVFFPRSMAPQWREA